MPNYPYDEIGTMIDRSLIAGLNKNFDEVEQDIRGVAEPLKAVLDGAFDAAALATNFGERAQEKLEEIAPDIYLVQNELVEKMNSLDIKVHGTASILNWEHLVIDKGLATEDWKDAFQAAYEFLTTSVLLNRLVFPSRIYQYSLSPNWAIQNVVIEGDGEVRLRYTGTENAVDLDAGLETGSAFKLKFTGFIVEAEATAKNAIFARGIHHSKIQAVVLGAGALYAGLRTEWCVCTDFDVTVTNNHQGWYKGAKPLYGYYIDKRELQASGLGGYTSWCKFTNPIVEGCQFGIYIDRGQGNSFYSGTSEGHSKKGIVLTENALYNKFIGVDLEANVEHDIYCLGKENEFISCDATGIHLFDGTARNNVITLGSHNQITFGASTYGNIMQNVKYNRFNNGSTVNDMSKKNRLMSNRNVGLNRTENRPPTSGAITVGASPFTYENVTGNDEMVHVMGGTVTQSVYAHGGYGDSIAGVPTYTRLCPGDTLKLTYTAAPTMRAYTT